MGMSTAVVTQVNRAKKVISETTNGVTLTYNEFQLVWSQTSGDAVLDEPRWGAFAFGADMLDADMVQEGTAMQMLFTLPFEAAKAKPTVGSMHGVMISYTDDCTLMDLRHTTSRAFPLLKKEARDDLTKHIRLYVACNSSVAALLELSKEDAACATLVKNLVFRDFTAPVPAGFAFLCQSPCIDRFRGAVQEAITTCRNKMRELDVEQHLVYWKRMLKKLVLMSAAQYYLSIACFSNHLGMSCLSVHPHNMITSFDCASVATATPMLQVPPFRANTTEKCSDRCLEKLNMYVYQGGCCSRTVEEAAQDFWRNIGLSKPLQLDMGNKADPFETNMNSSAELIQILLPATCPSNQWLGMTTDCMLDSCKRLNWPPQKCCDITCEKGSRKSARARVCVACMMPPFLNV
jgi:hypothetical protein